MQRLPRRALLAAAGLVVAGCLSPTLPLPPPSEPDVEPLGNGAYRLQGTLPRTGTALAMNTRTRLVFGQEVDDTSYDFEVLAEPGDQMVLWYQVALEASDSVGFTIPAGPVDAGAD